MFRFFFFFCVIFVICVMFVRQREQCAYNFKNLYVLEVKYSILCQFARALSTAGSSVFLIEPLIQEIIDPNIKVYLRMALSWSKTALSSVLYVSGFPLAFMCIWRREDRLAYQGRKPSFYFQTCHRLPVQLRN